ncbi:peptidoglycan-binding protein [Streptomyces sp. NPDC093085]|uniref:helix-turn-helix domain-containing protein n=1 Tax=Streptomyces sp. NPDC093085 TaxID=3155068 RepID=UPI003439A61C
MPRWKELPSELPEKDLQLLVQLRRLKDRSGLGLTGLAAKTGYSRSSWERYLNGKQPVPRGAVEALAKACGQDPTRLLVLHEVAAAEAGRTGETAGAAGAAHAAHASGAAEAAGKSAAGESAAGEKPGGEKPGGAKPESPENPGKATAAEAPETLGPAGSAASAGRTGSAGLAGPAGSAASAEGGATAGSGGASSGDHGPAGGGDPDAGAPEAPGDRPRRMVPLWAAVTGVVVALAAAFGAGLLLAPDDRAPESKAPEPVVYEPGRTYDCLKERKDGAAYAGHSVTRDALMDLNGSGRDVVEAQCLLKQHGFDPGDIDGLYGVRTKEEVRKFQTSRGLVSDGIVGPDTWGELRK